MTRVVALTAAGPGGPLTGSLWLPPQRPGAVVLMVPGSGASDRTSNGYFDPLRNALIDAGVAVAGFDKRGVGGSAGQWTSADIVDQADDIAAAAHAVREALPTARLVLYGHSQGGWVVLQAAAAVAPTAVVSASAAACTPNQQEVFSTVNRLRRAGWDDDRAARGGELIAEQFVHAESGQSWADHTQWLALHAAELDAMRPHGVFVVDDSALWGLTGRVGAFDTVAVAATLTCPLFVVLGADDFTNPVELGAQRYAEVAGSLREVHLLPGVGHRLELADGELHSTVVATVLAAAAIRP